MRRKPYAGAEEAPKPPSVVPLGAALGILLAILIVTKGR